MNALLNQRTDYDFVRLDPELLKDDDDTTVYPMVMHGMVIPNAPIECLIVNPSSQFTKNTLNDIIEKENLNAKPGVIFKMIPCIFFFDEVSYNYVQTLYGTKINQHRLYTFEDFVVEVS